MRIHIACRSAPLLCLGLLGGLLLFGSRRFLCGLLGAFLGAFLGPSADGFRRLFLAFLGLLGALFRRARDGIGDLADHLFHGLHGLAHDLFRGRCAGLHARRLVLHRRLLVHHLCMLAIIEDPKVCDDKIVPHDAHTVVLVLLYLLVEHG